MKSIIGAAALTLLVSANGLGQTLQIPEQIDRLGPKARETVNITLDGSLLQLASQFMSSTDKDQAKIKNIISKLKGIQVRTFEFDREAQYSDADIAPIRSQLRAPVWSRIFESRSEGEHVEIFVKQDKDKIGGLVLLSAERKELAIVSIDGSIDLTELSTLGGQFGIPSGIVPGGGTPRPTPEPRPAPQGGGKKDGDE
jgi:Domain of unknown function (DUF4252)